MFIGVCHADIVCSGTDFYDSDLEACTPCPTGYDHNDSPGKTSVTQCEIQCPNGQYVEQPGAYGYTRLEYLESTGQYIDTGFPHNSSNIRGEIRVGTTNNMNANVNILGNQTSSAGYSVGWAPSAFKIWVVTSNDRLNGPTHALSAGSIHDIEFELTGSRRILTYDGQTVSSSHKGGIVPANNIRLFDNGAGQSNQTFKGRIYYIKLYEDGNLVHNFIPVKRNSDNVVGIYDTVTGRFFTKTGSGEFMYGQDVQQVCVNSGPGYYAEPAVVKFGEPGVRTRCPAGRYSNLDAAYSLSQCSFCPGATYSDRPGATSCKNCPTGFTANEDLGKTDENQCQISCPAGTYLGTYVEMPSFYERLDFIQSNGTPYIDTGINVSTLVNPVMSITMQYTTVEANKKTGAAASSDGAQFTIGINASKAFACSAGNNATLGSADTNKHTFVLDTQNGTCSMDDTTQTFTIGDLSGINKTIHVGGINGITGRVGKAKYYNFTLTSNNQVIMNLIPARRKSDSVAGMYDTISKTFYTSSGANNTKFTAGSVFTRDICIDVGEGHYAPSSLFNYGDTGGRYECAVGLTTPGYGHGADSVDDCGRLLHLGDQIIYMRQNKITTPSINIEMSDLSRFYIPLSNENHNISKLHIWYNGAKYTAYDDGLIYGERNPVTGARIQQ